MMPCVVGNIAFSADGVVSASRWATASLGSPPTTTRLAAVKAETAQRLNRDDIEISLGLRIRCLGFTRQKSGQKPWAHDSAATMALLAATRKDRLDHIDPIASTLSQTVPRTRQHRARNCGWIKTTAFRPITSPDSSAHRHLPAEPR